MITLQQARNMYKHLHKISQDYEALRVKTRKAVVDAALKMGLVLETLHVFSTDEGYLTLHEDYSEADSELIDLLYRAKQLLEDLYPQYGTAAGLRTRCRLAEIEMTYRDNVIRRLLSREFDEAASDVGRQLAEAAEACRNRFRWAPGIRPERITSVSMTAEMNCQSFVEYAQAQAWGEHLRRGAYNYPEHTRASDAYHVEQFELRYLAAQRRKLRAGDVLVFGADSRDHVAIYLGAGQVASLWTHNDKRTFIGPLAGILESDPDKFYDPDTVAMITRTTCYRQVADS